MVGVSGDDRIELVLSEFRELLGREQIDAEIPLVEQGIDSIEIMQLLMIFEYTYGSVIEFDQIELNATTSLAALNNYARSSLGKTRPGR